MENNPYAPSASTLESAASAAASRGGDGFLDLSGLTDALCLLLWLSVAMGLLNLVFEIQELVTLAEADSVPRPAEVALGLMDVLLSLTTMIVFCRWVYRAHRNLPELGARYLPCSPGWAVGSFFIPVVNLWAPYQAMQSLGKVSHNPWRWELEDSSPLILLWWVLWVISLFLNYSILQMEVGPTTQEMRRAADILSVVSSLLWIPDCVLLRSIILKIWRTQSDRFDHMHGRAVA